jgi:hypothetical protein
MDAPERLLNGFRDSGIGKNPDPVRQTGNRAAASNVIPRNAGAPMTDLKSCSAVTLFDNDQKSAAPADALRLAQMLRSRR